MSFALTKTTVTLDDRDFEAFVNEDTNVVYFAERVEVKGILNFGTVAQGTEARISLEDNGITSDMALSELFALTPTGQSDEIYLNLYIKGGSSISRIHKQKISAGQMPYDIPAGVLRPNMIIGVVPSQSNLRVVLYVKPVSVLFEATPNPPQEPSSEDFSEPQPEQNG